MHLCDLCCVHPCQPAPKTNKFSHQLPLLIGQSAEVWGGSLASVVGDERLFVENLHSGIQLDLGRIVNDVGTIDVPAEREVQLCLPGLRMCFFQNMIEYSCLLFVSAFLSLIHIIMYIYQY